MSHKRFSILCALFCSIKYTCSRCILPEDESTHTDRNGFKEVTRLCSSQLACWMMLNRKGIHVLHGTRGHNSHEQHRNHFSEKLMQTLLFIKMQEILPPTCYVHFLQQSRPQLTTWYWPCHYQPNQSPAAKLNTMLIFGQVVGDILPQALKYSIHSSLVQQLLPQTTCHGEMAELVTATNPLLRMRGEGRSHSLLSTTR